MIKHYILVNREPVEVDLMEWARWLQENENDRSVKKTKIAGTDISTAFLGVDHNFSGEGSPILFETMILGGPYNQYCWRYSTWDEAIEGHNRVIELVSKLN